MATKNKISRQNRVLEKLEARIARTKDPEDKEKILLELQNLRINLKHGNTRKDRRKKGVAEEAKKAREKKPYKKNIGRSALEYIEEDEINQNRAAKAKNKKFWDMAPKEKRLSP